MTRDSEQHTGARNDAEIGTNADMHDDNQQEETVFLETERMESKQADVSEVVGKFGRYHFVLILVNILRAIPIGWTLTSVDFLAGDVDHSCAAPSHYKGQDWESEGRIFATACSRHHVDIDGFVNVSLPHEDCTSWTFNESQPSSAVVEWELVCERAWMKSAIQSVAFLGQLFGALVFGKLADKYGRLLMFDLAAVTMLIFGVAGSFAPLVEMFNVIRFLQAMSTAGLQTLSAALYSEVALPADRNYLHLGMTLGLGITQLLLPALAKWFDNWRYVQLATGLSAAALLPFLFYMEESPRWLLSVGQHKRGEQVLKRILRKNGSHDTDLVKKMPQLIQKASQGPPSASLKDLWPFQNVRRNLFVMFFLWAINNLALFGITYLPSKLGGDRFFNFTAASSAEIPAGFVGLYVIRKLRRRNSLTGILLICSTALLATALIPMEYVYVRVACMFVARFCVVITTATMWVFTMELFPTSIRSFALSLCFFVGRSSAALAPFLRDLADYQQPAPFALLAFLTALCALVLRLSPETLGKPLPDSMMEADLIGRENRMPKNVV